MFTISSNRINLNFGPRNFIFGDMQVQSWHFVQKIHKNQNFKNSIQGFCLLCSPKSQKIKNKNPIFYLNLKEDSKNYKNQLKN